MSHVYTADGRRLYTLAQLPEVTGISHNALKIRRSRGRLPEPDAYADERTPLWTKESVMPFTKLNDAIGKTYESTQAIADGLARLDAHSRAHYRAAVDASTCKTCRDGCNCPGGSGGCGHLGCWGLDSTDDCSEAIRLMALNPHID